MEKDHQPQISFAYSTLVEVVQQWNVAQLIAYGRILSE